MEQITLESFESNMNIRNLISEIRNEIESKYPRLYKTLSKLKSFVKSNEDLLNSLSETSGYSHKEVLKLLSVRNLSSMPVSYTHLRAHETG
jgi:hypothetical protein